MTNETNSDSETQNIKKNTETKPADVKPQLPLPKVATSLKAGQASLAQPAAHFSC